MAGNPSRQREQQRIRPVMVLVALLVSTTVTLSAATPAIAASSDSSDPAAAVQQVLDRVLGPDHAIVRIIEHRRTGLTTVLSTRFTAPGVPVAVSSSRITGSAETQRSTRVVDAVPETVASVVTPAGTLQFEQVTVVLDRNVVSTRSLRTLRALIGAAAGSDTKRGDTVRLALVPFARTPQALTTRAQPDLLPLLPAGEIGLGMIVAVGVVTAFVRRATRNPRRELQ